MLLLPGAATHILKDQGRQLVKKIRDPPGLHPGVPGQLLISGTYRLEQGPMLRHCPGGGEPCLQGSEVRQKGRVLYGLNNQKPGGNLIGTSGNIGNPLQRSRQGGCHLLRPLRHKLPKLPVKYGGFRVFFQTFHGIIRRLPRLDDQTIQFP